MPLPMDVIRARRGRVSYRWGSELLEAGLSPHIGDAAAELDVPIKTLISRLRRGDRGEQLKRARQRRPFHSPPTIPNRIYP